MPASTMQTAARGVTEGGPALRRSVDIQVDPAQGKPAVRWLLGAWATSPERIRD
jgi:hypothetical protein